MNNFDLIPNFKEMPFTQIVDFIMANASQEFLLLVRDMRSELISRPRNGNIQLATECYLKKIDQMKRLVIDNPSFTISIKSVELVA